MPSIETSNLSKNYGSFVAVSNLNLKIEGAKCVGFLGPNGAGKTTALKMFTDLIRPSSGEALINGVNVHKQKKKALESVGTLIEMPEIYPALTPREALTMIAEIRGVPKAERKRRVEDAVSEVRMDEWIDKRVGKFSKGMKQRICVASAILSDPSVVLLDEPTTGHAFWQTQFDHWEKVPESISLEVIAGIRKRRGLPEEVPKASKFIDTA